ncbi:glycoside hydrolase family 16 protein [Stipitochalara longipes BDJ]|nr:glycoside hydrolase family 16 protein [Stipitochalara longipes BDJ]
MIYHQIARSAQILGSWEARQRRFVIQAWTPIQDVGWFLATLGHMAQASTKQVAASTPPKSRQPPSPSGSSPALAAPQASFEGCDIQSHFNNLSLGFDNTFCGDWAAAEWPFDAICAPLDAKGCVDFVARNPGAFGDSYWVVNYVEVYTLGIAPTTSSRGLASTTEGVVRSMSTTSRSRPATRFSSSSSSLRSSASSSARPSVNSSSSFNTSSSKSATNSSFTPMISLSMSTSHSTSTISLTSSSKQSSLRISSSKIISYSTSTPSLIPTSEQSSSPIFSSKSVPHPISDLDI